MFASAHLAGHGVTFNVHAWYTRQKRQSNIVPHCAPDLNKVYGLYSNVCPAQ